MQEVFEFDASTEAAETAREALRLLVECRRIECAKSFVVGDWWKWKTKCDAFLKRVGKEVSDAE